MNLSNPKDKNGEDLKIGDYLYYSERPHSQYADSLLILYKNENNEFMTRTLVFNKGFREFDGEYIKHPASDFHDINIEFNQWEDGRMIDVLKVYPEGDLVEWMNSNFPLNKGKNND